MPKNTNYLNDSILPISITAEPIDPVVIFAENTPDYIRKDFISKVYTILWFQLLFTSSFIGICNQAPVVANFIKSSVGINLCYISFVVLFILMICLMCNNNLIKQNPYNWIFTISFTILMTYIMGIVGVMYSTKLLLLGGMSTLGIFSGLTIYAWQTKYDYTTIGNYLLISLIGLIMFGFLSFFIESAILNIFYSVIGSIIFSFYIVYDTQLIVGGTNRKIQLSVNDFAIASITLYLDVLNLFLFILDILGGNR